MVLPEVSNTCDAIELAAVNFSGSLSLSELVRIFAPNENQSSIARDDSFLETIFIEALQLADRRRRASLGQYPFKVSDRTIEFVHPKEFNIYLFLLIGGSLRMGIPEKIKPLQVGFRRYFEDVACWALRKLGFASEILSIPREVRGMPKSLVPALQEISRRFGVASELDSSLVTSDDNDLDVDIVSVPFRGNGERSGWPSLLIQCSTGTVEVLQSKLDGGRSTFSTVWRNGFRGNCSIRSVATHHDLLLLDGLQWGRLEEAGWVLDRTRLAYLTAHKYPAKLPATVERYWVNLWKCRGMIDWQNTIKRHLS